MCAKVRAKKFAFPKGPHGVAAVTILFPEEPYGPSSPLRSLLAWKVLHPRMNFNAFSQGAAPELLD